MIPDPADKLGGSIHLFFEGMCLYLFNYCTMAERSLFPGYFAYNHTSMPGKQDILGQLWKEYSYSDSRYLTSDPFVLCMETITAVCPFLRKSSVFSMILSEL